MCSMTKKASSENKDPTGYKCSNDSGIKLMPRRDYSPGALLSQMTTVTDGPQEGKILGEMQRNECVCTEASLDGNKDCVFFHNSPLQNRVEKE